MAVGIESCPDILIGTHSNTPDGDVDAPFRLDLYTIVCCDMPTLPINYV
jgi:hypothetical protein